MDPVHPRKTKSRGFGSKACPSEKKNTFCSIWFPWRELTNKQEKTKTETNTKTNTKDKYTDKDKIQRPKKKTDKDEKEKKKHKKKNKQKKGAKTSNHGCTNSGKKKKRKQIN